MSDTSQGPGWWKASDGRWYPPEQAPGAADSSGPRYEYMVEVNKKSLNVQAYTVLLNQRGKAGWRFHLAFEQAGNTVTVYERPLP